VEEINHVLEHLERRAAVAALEQGLSKTYTTVDSTKESAVGDASPTLRQAQALSLNQLFDALRLTEETTEVATLRM
jgi:hypothetical protein